MDFLGISYTINPFLVRGLDYYEHTVFEWVSPHLGSQATLCAGGRYNPLVEQLGGPSTPAVGFAMGCERLLLLLEQCRPEHFEPLAPAIFIMALGQEGLNPALKLAEELRNAPLGWSVEVNTAGGSVKSQFKKADKSGAILALILGEDELRSNMVTIKPLRISDEQKTISQQDLSTYLQHYLGEKHA